ncbi:hypothetical protein NDU88_002168 [Pleurodeles waltl]|uniref:Uncharacterized protein n=1 Tax=Pleurodeles waltl TaxID=8319 RepID=A0AAV7VD28_PLEWA|nr:hypothetical protein NDU88_002168 [Pleurodeles waltl]
MTRDRERSPENPQPDRKGKNRQNKTGRLSSPSPQEILKERQKAMEAAASLSVSDHGSAKQSQEDLEHSESEQESEFSHSSDKQGPDVTPGTSDNIIRWNIRWLHLWEHGNPGRETCHACSYVTEWRQDRCITQHLESD